MYLHSGADLHPFQEARHLGIGDSNTTLGPVQVTVYFGISPTQPMDTDVPSKPGVLWRDATSGMGSLD